MNNGQAPRRPRGRASKNVYTTKSGTDIKLNRSFTERRRAQKDALARQRAARLSSLPADRWKRVLYSLHPKRVAQYWFSREGAIMALKVTGVGIVVCFLLLVGLFAYFRKDLPKITDIDGNRVPGSITYYDKTGQTVLWQDYDAVKRIPVAHDKISDYIKNATIAIEDKDFYTQGAFNVRGIARAAVHDVTNQGGTVQGGSTITQQLVKLSENWTNERTISRKIKEIILAVELERSYSKDDIITGYLNLAPYGGIEVGVESAARDYFGTTAKDLTLAQASMLAAIPQAPDFYSPYGGTYDEEHLVGRQHYILDKMVEQKMVTKEEAEAAKKAEAQKTVKPLQPKYSGIKAPYFVLSAKDELERTYLSKTTTLGGWKVNTSVDLDLQTIAEQQVTKAMPRVIGNNGDTAAFVAIDVTTGEVVSAVGGDDFNNEEHGKLNFAHSVQVSPGSTFKPYDYAAFIDKSTNVGGGSVLYDVKGKVDGYACDVPFQSREKPGNCLADYDFIYPGPVTLRYALGGSRNVPAVKAMATVGVTKTIEVANALMAKEGAYKCYKQDTDVFSATKDDETRCFESSAIGDGAYLHLDNHANGIASLSRLGKAMPQTYIHSITDAKGKKVELKKREAKQAIRPDSAYIVNDMAADNKASYLHGLNNCSGSCGFHDYKGWKFAIKTGTTNDTYDGLMASWSSKYATMTWVGDHTRTVPLKGSMEQMTAPIARGWMQYAHDRLPKVENWIMPSGVKSQPAYVIRSKVSRLGEVVPSSSTDLYPSWYTPKTGNTGSAVIDKISNKLATDCTPAAAKMTVGNSNANSFSVDKFYGSGANANTSATDDVHKCEDAKPTVILTVSSSNGGNQTNICDEDGCTITATVTAGTHPLGSGTQAGKLNISVNGTVVKTVDINDPGTPQTFSVNYQPSGSGSATVTATIIDSVLYDGNATQSITLEEDDSENGQSNGNNNGQRRIFN